ncbi:CYFA0S18e01948g1_1 [Cyberlindnera fabianii]|nr:CYFA0S18e01948g1_1 [Cyberlindnera fabianii]
MLQIEYNASMIVRLVEELLSVSRTLKENWILGQLPKTNEADNVDPLDGMDDKINEVLKRILHTKQFDEEVEDDESEEEEEEEEEQEPQEQQKQEQEVIPEIKSEIKVEAPSDDIMDGMITAAVDEATNEKKVEVKQEETGADSNATTEATTTNGAHDGNGGETNATNGEPEPQIPPIEDVIEIADDVLGQYDFDNFGDMGDDVNDIIMLD